MLFSFIHEKDASSIFLFDRWVRQRLLVVLVASHPSARSVKLRLHFLGLKPVAVSGGLLDISLSSGLPYLPLILCQLLFGQPLQSSGRLLLGFDFGNLLDYLHGDLLEMSFRT